MSSWISAYWFSVVLVAGTVVTGLICLINRVFWVKSRATSMLTAQSASGDQQIDYLNAEKSNASGVSAAWRWLVGVSREFFPVLALVLVLRSFLFEPFQIPSGSMMPTLLAGDFILVQKFAYGLREPISNKVMLATKQPKRGDVAVFRYPPAPEISFIKRIVGLPGDRVIYQNKGLWIQSKCEQDGVCEPLTQVPLTYLHKSEYEQMGVSLDWYIENLGGSEHAVLRNPERGFAQPREWIVPQGHYFVMGDNRDNSQDSRFWGFVPHDHLIGKAVVIWTSFEFDESRKMLSWLPSKVRFERIGRIE